jgi:hypothetical protein
MRLPPSHVSTEDTLHNNNSQNNSGSNEGSGSGQGQFNSNELREAFLVRRARDSQPGSAKTSSRFASGMWSGLGMGGSGGGQKQRMGGAAAGWGPKGLADGIGIDARRYVEELLSLNR